MVHTPPQRLHRETANKGVRVSVAFISDLGCVRENNEDALVVADLERSDSTFANGELINWMLGEEGLLLAVADGMGGMNAGEVAASMAVEELPSLLQEESRRLTEAERIANALKSVNADILRAGREHPERRGMGAAITAALIHHSHATIGQVGDTRAYLVRGDRITQLTRDQSLVQSMIDAGLLEPEKAADFPYRNMINQALGAQDDLEPDLVEIDLEPDDYLVLCTDGLSNKVSSEDIREALNGPGTLYDACSKMVELARQRGGEDNITVIAARF